MMGTIGRRRFSILLALTIGWVIFFGLIQTSDVWATSSGESTEHGEAVAEGHGEEAGGAHGGGITSEKIWDLVWRALNFAVLFIILFVLLRKPASQFFAGRRENIAQTMADLKHRKAETENRFKELEGKLANLETEREKILAMYVREGEEEKIKIIENANEMAERIKQQAEKTIDLEVKSAKEDLIKEIADMSAAMAEDLVRKNINDQDQERLVEEYLEKVVQN